MNNWFVFKDDQKLGPYSKDELLELYAQGVIGDLDIIQSEDASEKSMLCESFDLNAKDNVPPLPSLPINDEDNYSRVTLPAIPIDNFKTKTNIKIPDLPNVVEEETASSIEFEDLTENGTSVTIPSLPLDDFKTKTGISLPSVSAINQANNENEKSDLSLEAKNTQESLNDEIECKLDEKLTSEFNLAKMDLNTPNEKIEEKNIEIEILDKERPKKKTFSKIFVGILLLLITPFIILFFIDLDPKNMKDERVIVKNKDINQDLQIKQVNNNFEKDFVNLTSFEKYPKLKSIISDKSRGLDLKIDGQVLKINTCYQGNFLALKKSVSDTGVTKFKILKIVKQYPKKVKFFKYKCIKHDVEALLESDLSFGKLINLKIFYCPTYVDKAASFKRKYNLSQKCFGLKTFDECWKRVSQHLKEINPLELITKENAAHEYIELVTFITNEYVRLENSDAMKTFEKCKKHPTL